MTPGDWVARYAQKAMTSTPGGLISCAACGHQVSPQASDCPNCGHPLPAKWKRYKNIVWVLMAVVLAVVVLTSLVRGIQVANEAPSREEVRQELQRAIEECETLPSRDAIECLLSLR